MEAKRFCPLCGNELPISARFCAKCGSALEPITPAPAQQPLYNAPQPQPTGYQNPQANYGQPMTPKYGEQQSGVQNSIPVKYADFGDRFVAFLIDSIIVNILLSIAFWPFGSNIIDNKVITGIVNFVYHFAMEMANGGAGQTLGKKIMNIKTVDSTSFGSITAQQAAIHIIGKVVFLPIDVILGLITKEKSLPDKEDIRIMQRLAKTSVIKLAAK
jgi:uncharacterized RDD family membrane protein YckC